MQLSLTYYLMVAKGNCYFFTGGYASAMTSGIMVNGEIVHISDNDVHLSHNISTSDRDSMILAAKRAFWKSYNNFVCNFGHLYSLLKISVFAPFCCSFYGSPLWLLNSTAVLTFFVCGLEEVVDNVMACSSNDTL